MISIKYLKWGDHMARKQVLKGLLDISPEALNKMTTKELKAVVQVMASAGNKRVKRLENMERGTNAPAYQKFLERGEKFSTKGKTLNELRNEYKNLKSFLGAKTSSVSGYKMYRAKINKIMGGEDTGGLDSMTEAEEKQFWSMYRKWEEANGGFSAAYYDSFQAIRDLRRAMNERGKSEILQELNEAYGDGETYQYGYTNENGEYVQVNNSQESMLQMLLDFAGLMYQRGTENVYSDEEYFDIPF